MNPIAVYGPGLIGGSVALALREAFPSTAIHIWARRGAAAREAVEKVGGNCHAFAGNDGIPAAAKNAGLLVLCTPVETCPFIARELAPALGAEAVVTEAGSAKARPFHETAEILGPRFVGSHPMAGSERSGLAAARADLFQGALCIITPSKFSSPAAVRATAGFWKAIGCRIVECSPDEHDTAVARVSHAPHVAAAALALLAGGSLQKFSGPGYRDCTRVALGSPSLWREILAANSTATVDALSALENQIAEFRHALEEGNHDKVARLLQTAADIRQALHSNAEED